MNRAKWILLVLVPAGISGCRGGAGAINPNYGQIDDAFVPRASSGGAFDAYAQAALDAEATKSPYLRRTQFSQSARESAVKELEKMTRQVRVATSLPCDFEFRTREPFSPSPYLKGWRLIGRCLAWSTEASAKAGNFDQAIDTGLAATRFGFDLTQGDAMSADLGCTIVTDARLALLPALNQLSAEQLYRLAQGLKAAISRGPSLVRCAQNEHRQSLAVAQSIYDSAITRDLARLRTGLGAAGDNVVNRLTKEAENPTSLAKYTQNFADEADKMGALYIKSAGLPTSERAALLPKLEPGRPWRSLSLNFLTAVPTVQPSYDRTLARTRMFVIACMLGRERRMGKSFPPDLSKFSDAVRIDPYSGRDLGYESEGLSYRLFANGADTVADGGETDEAGLTPDLILESVRPYPLTVAPTPTASSGR